MLSSLWSVPGRFLRLEYSCACLLAVLNERRPLWFSTAPLGSVPISAFATGMLPLLRVDDSSSISGSSSAAGYSGNVHCGKQSTMRKGVIQWSSLSLTTSDASYFFEGAVKGL